MEAKTGTSYDVSFKYWQPPLQTRVYSWIQQAWIVKDEKYIFFTFLLKKVTLWHDKMKMKAKNQRTSKNSMFECILRITLTHWLRVFVLTVSTIMLVAWDTRDGDEILTILNYPCDRCRTLWSCVAQWQNSRPDIDRPGDQFSDRSWFSVCVC